MLQNVCAVASYFLHNTRERGTGRREWDFVSPYGDCGGGGECLKLRGSGVDDRHSIVERTLVFDIGKGPYH